MWHKTQHTENLFCGRKYFPDPAPPAHAPASVWYLHTMVTLTIDACGQALAFLILLHVVIVIFLMGVLTLWVLTLPDTGIGGACSLVWGLSN